MALPLILGAAALRTGIGILTREGPKAVIKKYGRDGLKQIEKARGKQLREIDEKAGFTGGKTIANPQKAAETLKRKTRERRIDAERVDDTLDILNEMKDEVPLKFSKGGLLSTDNSRMGYANGGDVPEIMQRINAAVNTEVTNAKKFGDDYFNAGTGSIFGRLSRELGSSGQGLKAFTDMKKINNDMKGEFTNEQLATMLNKGYQDAELPYRFELPKNDREKKAEGELVGGQKELDLNRDGDLDEKDFEMLRERKQEGGMMDDQMDSMMQREEAPVMETQMADMMPEKTEEQIEIEESQVPDEMMENNYIDFLIDEALDEDEEEMLMEELQANPQLSMLFDKVMEVAMEFSGSGPVEGPGTEVSDSIPARLSDGEFVFTAKAVEEIGADSLMSMMKEAEAAADERQGMQEGGVLSETTTTTRRFADPMQEDEEEVMQDEKTIQDMRGTNPRMQ